MFSASDLAKEQKMNFGDDIASQLRSARKKRFSIQEEKRIAQEIEMQTYLTRLIEDDKEKQINEIKLDDDIRKDEKEILINEAEVRAEKFTNELNNLLSKVDERRRKREVPDYLCGKISFEILQEPVITPSGITYDKKDLEEHLQVKISTVSAKFFNFNMNFRGWDTLIQLQGLN